MAEQKERLDQRLKILESGDFTKLMGDIEDGVFECKAAPYYLDNDAGVFELAKDVAAFANSDGGLIVLGLETVSVPERAADVVRTSRLFTREYFIAQRYQALLDAHIYPRIEGLTLTWHASTADPKVGLASIRIPRQSDMYQPFLVNRFLGDDGKVRGTALSYFERHRDGVDRKEAKDFHYLIRAGRTIASIEARLIAIELASQGRGLTTPKAIDQAFEDRVEQAVSLAGLSERPAYTLVATPIAPVSVPELFSAQRSKLVEVLESPPELRYGGFDIGVGVRMAIVEGKLRRALHVESHRNLELWKDGVLIFVAPADENFLCWGQRPPPPLIINPIALLESVYLFCLLTQQVQQHTDPRNCGIKMTIKVQGMDERFVMRAGVVGSFGWNFGGSAHGAPKASVSAEESWPGPVEPAILAFRVARKLYEWFGLAHDQIPYTTGEGEERRLDTDTLKRL